MTYVPPHFELNDRDEIAAFLSAHPFGTLVVHLDGQMWPTPLPLIHKSSSDGYGSFICHVARANDMWKAAAGQDVLVIVNGPNGYITPNWYATKAETHEVVPTWNYAAVHAWGRMTIHHEPKWKRMAVGMLTQIHERRSDIPWKMGDAPQEYLAGQLELIVGIEIAIDRIKAKYKLSQNRSDADRDGVLIGLQHRGDSDELTHLMKQAHGE
jgi:transcriptional regulator